LSPRSGNRSHAGGDAAAFPESFTLSSTCGWLRDVLAGGGSTTTTTPRPSSGLRWSRRAAATRLSR
jgi:hypothetical protein